ncbi:MAG TPA: hypothetical protein VKX17_25405 [Planctomycetota bacterium]|nr:hypothetical protein [Planctomycetota bacterium]
MKEKDKEKKMKKKGIEKPAKEPKRPAKSASDNSDGPEVFDGELDGAEPELEAEAGAVELPPRAKSTRAKRGAKVDGADEKSAVEPEKPQTRLGLIRARHESMRREIDQIREDLESDEEE